MLTEVLGLSWFVLDDNNRFSLKATTPFRMWTFIILPGGAQLGYRQVSFCNIAFTEVYSISFDKVMVCKFLCMDFNHGPVYCSLTEVDGSCIYILYGIVCGIH